MGTGVYAYFKMGDSMKVLLAVVAFFCLAIVVFLSLSKSVPENLPSSEIKKELAKPGESTPPLVKFKNAKSKELNFTDEKGTSLFNGKKILLIPGKIEIENGVEFQLVTDDNGRWKIELTSNDYAFGESNSIFEEDNLYPINGESLKELTTIILTKTEK